MSSANVLPSASEYGEQLYPMHEITQINAEDFRSVMEAPGSQIMDVVLNLIR